MTGISQRQVNGLKSIEAFRSKVIPVIEDVELEVRKYLAGAGPTRSRPRVNRRAIARRAKVNRTTFRAPYHADLVSRIDKQKELLKTRSKAKSTTQPRKRNRTARPTRKDLIDQLAVTAQALRDSDRERHVLAQKAKMYELPEGAIALGNKLQDEQIVQMLKSLLARRTE